MDTSGSRFIGIVKSWGVRTLTWVCGGPALLSGDPTRFAAFSSSWRRPPSWTRGSFLCLWSPQLPLGSLLSA